MLDAKPILSVLFFSKELPELRVQIIGYLLKSQIKSNFVGGVGEFLLIPVMGMITCYVFQ